MLINSGEQGRSVDGVKTGEESMMLASSPGLARVRQSLLPLECSRLFRRQELLSLHSVTKMRVG
jgi:hypothetical protein